ncbi:response regulator [Clostridiaceae bacterium]|nr:response regulator [Clostridiaceae bacterium]NBH32516.1 response regulator [Clostridiaceae bacterium]
MKIRVVAVDNAPELLEKIQGIFRNMEQVELLGCFEEAVAVVDFVRENQVDLVFTDIVMPDISGISLASALHRLEHPPAVVLMSSIPGFSLEAWKIQAFGFIEKPYTRRDVVKMVEKYGRERKLPPVNRDNLSGLPIENVGIV